MALDENFAEAWINNTHKAFGWTLQPFSLWHKLILGSIDSPITRGDEEDQVNATDIYAAASICRLSYPHQPKRPRFPLLTNLIKLTGPRRVAREVQKFVDYLTDYNSMPEFWQKKEEVTSGANTGPPEELSTVTALMLLGMSEAEAWNCSIGKASWYSAAYTLFQGADIEFMSADEKEMRENWAEIEGELKKKAAEFVPPSSDNDKVGHG